jgi:hypothetical protein
MTEDEAKLPKEIARHEFTLMGIPMTMHVLDNGERIFGSEGVHALLERVASEGLDLGEILKAGRP